MSHRTRALFVLASCIVAIQVAAADEPGRALEKAKQEYRTNTEKAVTALVAKLDERIKMVAETGNLEGVLKLRADKKAFEADGKTPTSPLMRTANEEHQRSVKSAKKAMSDALELAVKEYTKKLDIDKAEEVKAELNVFTKSGTLKGATARPAPAAPELAAVVEYQLAPGVKMVFCPIPAGKAKLCSPPDEAGRRPHETEHEFETKDFWLGKYEVTQAEWVTVTGANPSQFDGEKANAVRGQNTARYPVEDMTWDDCQRFVA